MSAGRQSFFAEGDWHRAQGAKSAKAEWGEGGVSRSEGVLGNATQCLRFTLSEEVFCFIRNMECCQAISQSRGALKVVKQPY